MHSVYKKLFGLGAAAALSFGFAQLPVLAQSQPPSSAQQPGASSGGQQQPGASSGGQQQPGQSEASKAVRQSKQADQQMQELAKQGEKLIGKELLGANEEKVGEIRDVVMGQDGKLMAVLVDVGGFLGMGGKTIAIPSDQLKIQGDQVVASNLTKQTAESMPEYEEQSPQQNQQNQQNQKQQQNR